MNTTGSDRSSGEFSTVVELSFDRSEIEAVQSEVARELAERGFDESAAFAVRLAIEEALVNGFRHGNGGDLTKKVRFECRINSSSICIEVIDEGPGFNPDGVPDPTHESNLETPSGRGIMLMKAYMSEVEYLPPGNRVRMSYHRTPA
ncbi:MAG: ATP-binding protein [Phycisphaerales bacterium]|nr:ATP-binding protein [Phycisphaerales bacterium]